MSKYGEPWITDGYNIYGPKDARSKHRNERTLIGGLVDRVNDWRTEDGYIDHAAAHAERKEAADRIVSCVNAFAGVPHPEKLPALLLALRAQSVAEAKYDALDKGSAPMEEILDATARVAAAGAKVQSAYKAMMGETT